MLLLDRIHDPPRGAHSLGMIYPCLELLIVHVPYGNVAEIMSVVNGHGVIFGGGEATRESGKYFGVKE